MRLERLEISGFKSFPERADLAFDTGVTAIVGPNGCGKSNVVDAITWVLGEQSAKSLRGERMEDVIFNGSDARKPNGAAEVRLRLRGIAAQAFRRATERRGDEGAAPGDADGAGVQIDLPATDLRDVEVARRLYRSGESEYLIDGEVVRLRDVQDLLMDAGVGVKGYAVIEQGKIGQILSAKPTERRQLIEEAAGVTKYKSRRRAAELKLEAAQQNLTRVDDIVFELEKQRAALKRQAAKARRYRRLREELRRWEKVLFARRYRALSQAIEAALARLGDARQRTATAADAVASVERAAEALRHRLGAADADLVAARDALHGRQLEIERRQQQVEFDRQQTEALARAMEAIEAEVAALEQRREPVRAELGDRRAAFERSTQERDDAARALAGEEQAHGEAVALIATFEAGVEGARGRVMAGLSAIAALRNVIERATETRGRIAAELSRLDVEAGDLRIEADQLAAERDRAEGSLRDAEASVGRAREARLDQEGRLALARASRDERLRDLREQERQLAAATARLASLEELEAAREGYGEAARAILRDGLGDVQHFGSLADYLETDGTYERAVEAGLGDLLQAVVVRTGEDAERALALVRDRGLGRCGFLILEGGATTRNIAPLDGALPLASVVRVRGDAADAIRTALGEVWIAESFEAASRLAASTAAPVATFAGDVFRGGRLVVGGGRSEGRGILATKREIKELRERLTDDHARVLQATEQLAALERAIASAEQTLLGTVSELHVHEKTALEHQLHLTRTHEALERVARKREQIDQERHRAEDERHALEARHDEAARSVGRLDAEQRNLDAHVLDAQQQLARARDEAAIVGTRLADAKAAHAGLIERAAALGNEVARIEEAVRDLESRVAAGHDERQRNAHRRHELQAAIAENARRLEADQHDFAALRDRVHAAEATLAGLQDESTARDLELRDARAALDDARGAVGQLDVVRATAEADLAHLSQTCAETLQANLDEVAEEVSRLEAAGEIAPDAAVIYADDETDEELAAPPDGELAETPGGDAGTGPSDEAGGASPAPRVARAVTAEEAIAELRAKIDRLGPVNMMAIEQFDDLETRYSFLVTQRQDLVDSIASTGEAIKRIDKTTRERFREAYAAINKYFEEMFTTLFGGGRAGLVMLDEDDLLESGIDIIAQPPGKRLQNVQLLSGGEKALTAMALLFAMFRYRPSPFCLLDEIDAPLDDANIGRFLEMLKGMLDRTQFIVVTHSRKTMEMADRLYGVTMEEPGVSKLISLKLN